MKRTQLFPIIIMILAAVLPALAGCGKKGDPVPPQFKPLPAIVDLKTASAPEGIVLSWSLPSPGVPIGSFKLSRSVTVDGSQACPGCPQDYRPFGTITMADERLRREGDKGFRYADRDVRDGSYYSYRLSLCNRTGQCSAASNEAGAVYKETIR
jgi:predicted small lipoprotein YifL